MKRLPELLACTALAGAIALALAFQPGETSSARAATPSAPAASKPAAVEADFAIRGVRVFDGERDLGTSNVIVRSGRIAAVGTDAAVPAGMQVIDGSGKTLLPGLIDAHVHAWGDAQRDMLRFGVTVAIDMHGVTQRLPDLRKQRESLDNSAQADLWAAGVAVTAPGGHGTQYGFEVPTVDAKTDIPKFVDARVAEGADFIKIIVEDMSTHGTNRRLPTLDAAQVPKLIQAAHRNRKIAVVHVSPQRDAMLAVNAGADGLAHLFVDAEPDAAFLAAARERKLFVIPTLSVLANYAGKGNGAELAADSRLKSALTAEQIGSLQQTFPKAMSNRPQLMPRLLASVRALHEAGIDILAGTDAGNPGTAQGVSLHGELELLVRAGLTPAQALAAATSLPAKRFGMTERGRIAVGQRADLVLVAGNPLDDITATRAIETVWKNGRRVERDPKAGAAPAEAIPDGALVSDFETDGITARFGSWQDSTDKVAGGASSVTHARVDGGAGDSRGALQVTGEVKAGFAYPWSGVMFFPATQAMQPVGLRGRRELVFQVRGDGRTYSAMVMSGASVQGMPSLQSFEAGPQWREVRLKLADFRGADLGLVRGIGFTAGQPAGTFEFRIDNVELR